MYASPPAVAGDRRSPSAPSGAFGLPVSLPSGVAFVLLTQYHLVKINALRQVQSWGFSGAREEQANVIPPDIILLDASLVDAAEHQKKTRARNSVSHYPQVWKGGQAPKYLAAQTPSSSRVPTMPIHPYT